MCSWSTHNSTVVYILHASHSYGQCGHTRVSRVGAHAKPNRRGDTIYQSRTERCTIIDVIFAYERGARLRYAVVYLLRPRVILREPRSNSRSTAILIVYLI